jgi:hypothetical protein
MIRAIAALPRKQTVALDPLVPPLPPGLDRLHASMTGREREIYRPDLNLSGDELWELTEAFRARIWLTPPAESRTFHLHFVGGDGRKPACPATVVL